MISKQLLSVQQKVSDLETKLNQPQEIPLNEAVHKGDEFQKELSTCRSIQDKDERNRFKRKHLGAYSASGTFWTRDKDSQAVQRSRYRPGPKSSTPMK